MIERTRSLIYRILRSTLCAFSPAAVGETWIPRLIRSSDIESTPPSLSVMRWDTRICRDLATFSMCVMDSFIWGVFFPPIYWVIQNPRGDSSPTMNGSLAMNMIST